MTPATLETDENTFKQANQPIQYTQRNHDHGYPKVQTVLELQPKKAESAARSSLTASLIVLFVSLGFCLVIAEVISRIYLVGPLILLPEYGDSIHRFGESGLVKASTQPRICYEFKPHMNALLDLVPFHTNSDGQRDQEYSVQKPPGTYRVVVLGDSYTMPAGVKIEDAWHTLLENSYNAKSKDKKYEFINFGISGYNLDQYLATLEYRGLKYSPDHVIVGIFVGNDIPKIGAKPLPFPYRVKPIDHAYWRCYTWILIKRAWSNVVPNSGIAQSHNPWEPSKFDLKKIDDIFARFKELGEQHGFKVTLVGLRRMNEHQYEFDIFKRAAQRVGLPLIDAGTEFPDAGRRYYLYEADHHPNKRANAIFARTIEKSLRLD